ncbi:MAG: hypothetical protein H7Y01_12900 [Ferruginibacter sp.]|nr:hypothetical protein [Chitinophagaceae bacterium]
MKLTGYILAIYLLLLAAIPCCAFDDCPEDEMNQSPATEQAAGQESEDEDCGTCSPFFSCEGCATATIAFEPPQLEIAAFKITSVYTNYIQTALPTIDYEFWQPPKIRA